MTTPSGRPFAPRTCRRSLDEPLTGSQKVVNHDISQVPARATRGVDRVEGRARGWSSGECCSPEVAVGMEHTVRRAIPRTLSLRPATRVVARAVRHSQESTFSDKAHFVLPPPLARRSPAVHVRGTRVLLRHTPPLLGRRQARGEDRPPIGASPSPPSPRVHPSSAHAPSSLFLPSILVAHRRDPRRHRGGSPRLADRAQTRCPHHARGVRPGAHGARGWRGG